MSSAVKRREQREAAGTGGGAGTGITTDTSITFTVH